MSMIILYSHENEILHQSQNVKIMLRYTISKPLCILFNKSLSLKNFPECWKLAHVLTLFKKDDPSITLNYRPVSLLSCISKMFERIIFKHVYNHLHSQNLFYKYQTGFFTRSFYNVSTIRNIPLDCYKY